MKTPIWHWMQAASPEQREELARRTGTTRGMLDQYAGGHRLASAERAGEFERITAEMHKETGGALPKLYRTDLCAACAACPFARRCLGTKAEFPLVAEGGVG